MSTSTSPQPPEPGVSPFRDQTAYDPYLPASADEEQLTKIPSEKQPAGGASSVHHDLDPSATRRVNTNQSLGGVDRIESFGYGGLEGFEPQGFDNSLLLEDNFGPLPAPDDFNDMTFFRQRSFARTDTGRTEEPQSAATSKASNFSRRSTGIATHSSQLMSPVLTNVPSPESGSDVPYSPLKTKLLGGGHMSRVSSTNTAVNSTSDAQQGVAKRTPALTTSSNDVSPNLGIDQQPFPTTPSIHVNYHKRGDSPAPSSEMQQSLNKRRRGSRSSSMLAANSAFEAEDDEENTSDCRLGLDPQARGTDAVDSLEDQQQQRELTVRNADVSDWLSGSLHEGLHEDPNPPAGTKQHLQVNTRRRAVSTGNPSDLPAEVFGFSRGLQANTHQRQPGPGVLINEDSGDEDMDGDDVGSYVESAPASVDGNEAAAKAEELDTFPPLDAPLPNAQAAHPWADPIYMPSAVDLRAQPETANAAMMRFIKRAHDIETASRVATWGTIARRRSDGDLHEELVERVFGPGGLFSRLSLSREKDRDRTEKDKDDWRNFRETMQQAADRILPKRTNSTSKRKTSEPRPLPLPLNSSESVRSHKRKESSASIGSRSSAYNIVGRGSSLKRPKSPRIHTSGLAAAMATQVGALGVSGPMQPASPTSPVGWRAFKESAKERLGIHSRGGSPEASRVSSPPAIAAPQPQPLPAKPVEPVDLETDAEVGEARDEQGVKMEISAASSNIIPNFEGFKAHVRETNPRLPPYLVERLGQEQLRRYKKLVAAKVEHAKARETNSCASRKYCADRGGVATYFPAKNAPTKGASHTGLTTAGTGEEDEDEEAVADGIVSEAQFPPGLPLPPAKRLPAEFECPWCFTVKKFQKPSDWSKHVHEDLQPFTCTFQQCPEPKSFKRKADWVRHENERHRQLEWWQCSEDGCSHLCYRRDNFVQHLVREHKMPEPKAAKSSSARPPNKPAVRGPAKNKVKAKGVVNINDIPPGDRVLYMVELCRRETNKDPLDEPCRFCGNHCNSFKKLTVHLARHMESLALPVLDLVKAKDVSPDTLISPIDIKLVHQGLSPVDAHSAYAANVAGGSVVHTSPFNDGMDVGAADMAGMAPLVTSAGFAPAQYQTQWTNAPMPGQQAPPASTAGFVADAHAWTAASASPRNMYAAPAASPFAGYAPMSYAHHNSLPSPELYGMPATASPPIGNTAAAPQYNLQMGERPHFHQPHYVSEQSGAGMGDAGLGSAGMAEDMELQYDSAQASGIYEPQSRAPGDPGPYYGY